MDNMILELLPILGALAPHQKGSVEHYCHTNRNKDRHAILLGVADIIGVSLVKKAVSGCFSLPTITHEKAIKHCLPLTQGYYDPDSDTFFLENLHPQHVDNTSTGIGFVTEGPQHKGRPFPCNISGASQYKDVPPTFGSRVDGGLIYRGTVMQMFPVSNATFLQSVYHNSTDRFPFLEHWASMFHQVQENMVSANGRRLHFISGDGLSDFVKHSRSHISRSFVGRVGYNTKTQADLYIVPFRELIGAPEHIAHLVTCEEKHVILYSDSISGPRFVESLCTLLTIDFAIEFLNAYSAMRAIPTLCSECRITGKGGQNLEDRMFNKSETIERYYIKGAGCEHCYGGYSHLTWATEDFSTPGEMSKALMEFRSTKDFTEGGFSVQKLYDKLASDKKFIFPRSVKRLVESGNVQVVDANKIML